jgi:hypothetical protein
MKTELEEAAEKYAEIYRCPATNDNEYCKHDIISAINFGAKWQHQQSVDLSNVNANNITTASTQNQTLWKEMYSEEDMTEYAIYIVFNNLITPKQWFEQFKNKQNCLQIK